MSMPVRSGWGRLDFGPQVALAFNHRSQPLPDWQGHGSILPFGNGRSYGDSCLNTGGALIECRRLDRFISFNRETGVMRCEAGILFAEILDLAVPAGWILPAMPGTQLVTLGGAIANDVHGKNHHHAGTFGSHVLCFELLRSDGSRLLCSGRENAALFRATIGGLGLTGLIVWAEFQLKPVTTPYLQQETIRFRNLSEFFELSAASDNAFEYTVSWIDCLSTGASLGRGWFMRANHLAEHPTDAPKPPSRSLGIPFSPPMSLINSASLRLFNHAYYRKHRTDRIQGPVHYKPFFFPLDAIENWNRIYGPRGFYQYQCVLPMVQGEAGISEILAKISRSGTGSFLAVLKIFGDIKSPGMMSFPRPGVTLALDFPNKGTQTLAFLASLDEVIQEHGGALYPAKDARMPAGLFAQSYPALAEFRPHIDPAFSSSFWRRVAGTPTEEASE
jgi:FAD/FMN-containing dehydrogenase